MRAIKGKKSERPRSAGQNSETPSSVVARAASATQTNGGLQSGGSKSVGFSSGNNPANTRLVFGLNPKTNRLKHDEYAEKRSCNSVTPSSLDQKSRFQAEPPRSQESRIHPERDDHSDPTPRSNKTPTLRASKYGNFYKPQDLVCKPDELTGQHSRGKQEVERTRGKSPSRLNEPLTGDEKDKVNKLLGCSTQMKSTIVQEPPKQTKTAPIVGKIETVCKLPEERQQQANSRMQFNIPPPPQVSTANKSSVVSYAKSKIYDKPARQCVSSHPLAGNSILDSGAIPESILSGFKPPKQVNVSKAREKWEGGEPFAKCKSRQRLAAQAGKSLFHGAWPMTSVVATQQLQLQQALANSSSPTRSNVDRSDLAVKILTRGSVLERVQQFEKVPADSLSGSSSGSSSASTNSLLSSSIGGDETRRAGGSLVQSNIATSTTTHQLNESLGAEQKSATSRHALYKSRVSSIQISGSQRVDQPNLVCSPKSPQSPTNGRRFSLRRGSSTVSNSSTQGIPRFYHPNGKPNTYEIELQKKNIVACFDKLPDRKAQLTGPAYRRHFHSIALACGFSEYFKEPLYLYVRHQMVNSNLLHNTGSAIRKQSGLGLTNGISGAGQASSAAAEKDPIRKPKQLIRAASIDTSTIEKLQSQTHINCDQFLICWRNMISSCFDNASRFVHLLTLGKRNYLLPDDFIPLIQSVIDDHPGLKFLRAAPDFHMRYIQTVIARIYFCLNRSWTGKISLSELRRSNLLAVLQVLSQEEDINQITDYFSYEHFYVIYCKFWSLDQDHDLLIRKEDLARHNDAAISSRIIDRIFMGIVSKQIQQTGTMSYSDFVWFLLAEEDKKHPRSIEYWFRLMDIDGDGYISMYEMEYFYYEQTKRLELMNIEALPFLDSACQILDLVNPKEKNKISLSDLKRTKMATIFFDTFINLEKYLEHESREFVSARDVVQDGVVVSDWDRYASEEYEALVSEESSV